MGYRFLADAVVVVHLAFTVFVVAGAVTALRHPRLVPAHLAAVAWGAWIEFSGGICPLTTWENQLRQLSGAAGYSGGFVERYLLRVLYPDGLSREIQIGIGAAVLLVNGAAYAWLIVRRNRSRNGLPRAEETA